MNENPARQRSNCPGAEPDRENGPAAARHRLCLYVYDSAPASARAIANTRRFCDQHFAEGYDLRIVDIQKQPGEAVSAQIVAVPTLVRTHPAPLRRYIGDLSKPPLPPAAGPT